MVDLVARQVGKTLLVLWTNENGLARKVTAVVDQPGAQYSREVTPGQWHHENIRGSSKTVFSEIKQLSALVRMMYPRG